MFKVAPNLFTDLFEDERPPADMLEQAQSSEESKDVPVEELTLNHPKLGQLPVTNPIFKSYTAEKMMDLWVRTKKKWSWQRSFSENAQSDAYDSKHIYTVEVYDEAKNLKI